MSALNLQQEWQLRTDGRLIFLKDFQILLFLSMENVAFAGLTLKFNYSDVVVSIFCNKLVMVKLHSL